MKGVTREEAIIGMVQGKSYTYEGQDENAHCYYVNDSYCGFYWENPARRYTLDFDRTSNKWYEVKEKVDVYQWVFRTSKGDLRLSSGFYLDEADVCEHSTFHELVQRADWTKITVEV